MQLTVTKSCQLKISAQGPQVPLAHCSFLIGEQSRLS